MGDVISAKSVWYEQIEKNLNTVILDQENDIINENEIVLECFDDLIEKSMEFKSDDFSQEAEWRLIYKPKSTYWDNEPEDLEEQEEYKNFHYRLRDSQLIKYISLPLNDIVKKQEFIFGVQEQQENMMSNFVILGPKNQNDIDEIVDFLTMNDFFFRARRSKISYR